MKDKHRFLPILILIVIVLVSIGYSAFNRKLIVNDIGAIVRVNSDIRISGINVDKVSNNAMSFSENYNVHNIMSDINLPEENSTITFKVVVTNLGSANMGIYDINGLPENLQYEISDYNLKDKICDLNNKCNLGISKSFYITIKYAENGYNEQNVSYSINLDFDFRQIYKITYVLNDGINPSNQVLEFIAGDSVSILSPTKSHAIFDGWYENANFDGRSINNISDRYEDVVLYAKWHYIIYFQLPPDWIGDNVNVYLYNDKSGYTNSKWPGKKAKLENGDLKIYSYIVDNDEINNYINIIFTNISNSNETSERQTIDLIFSKDMGNEIFVPELYKSNSETRIFSTNYNYQSPNLYIWKDDKPYVSWPGEKMIDKISDSGYQAIINRSKYNMMILNVGNTQTEDLEITSYQDLTYRIMGSYQQKITRYYYAGNWHHYDNWLESEYDNWKKDDYEQFLNAQKYFNY